MVPPHNFMHHSIMLIKTLFKPLGCHLFRCSNILDKNSFSGLTTHTYINKKFIQIETIQNYLFFELRVQSTKCSLPKHRPLYTRGAQAHTFNPLPNIPFTTSFLLLVSEGWMLPRKALQHSGLGLIPRSLDTESQQKSPFLQTEYYKNLPKY